jgi:acyl-CoA dehydrogenase
MANLEAGQNVWPAFGPQVGGSVACRLRRTDLTARSEAVAQIAADNAAAVDRDARFPDEAIRAAREHGLLGVMIPHELGGKGASVADLAEVCYRLGQACSSTGMIYAMHQMTVASIVRHRHCNGWHGDLLRQVGERQLLLASSTTEGRGGGNVRSSEAAIEYYNGRITLERRATVISYAANADAIVTTARRCAEGPASDQVLVVFRKQDYTLEPLLEWDTLGMRGTCSAGFILRAAGSSDQILPDSYEKIHSQTVVPVAHLLWGSVWAGIAAGALERARLFIRQNARRAGGHLPPGAPHFTRASASLTTLRGLLANALQRYEALANEKEASASLDFQAMINMTKVEASELAVAIVMNALRASGLSGYRNDTEFSLGRYLRDILSSPLMISNDRILSNIGTAALMSPVPASVSNQMTIASV